MTCSPIHKSCIKSKSRGHHISAPKSAHLISPNEFLTSFMFNPKYAIILFTCLLFEHDQRHSNKDIQTIQKYLLMDGNTWAAYSINQWKPSVNEYQNNHFYDWKILRKFIFVKGMLWFQQKTNHIFDDLASLAFHKMLSALMLERWMIKRHTNLEIFA